MLLMTRSSPATDPETLNPGPGMRFAWKPPCSCSVSRLLTSFLVVFLFFFRWGGGGSSGRLRIEFHSVTV